MPTSAQSLNALMLLRRPLLRRPAPAAGWTFWTASFCARCCSICGRRTCSAASASAAALRAPQRTCCSARSWFASTQRLARRRARCSALASHASGMAAGAMGVAGAVAVAGSCAAPACAATATCHGTRSVLACGARCGTTRLTRSFHCTSTRSTGSAACVRCPRSWPGSPTRAAAWGGRRTRAEGRSTLGACCPSWATCSTPSWSSSWAGLWSRMAAAVVAAAAATTNPMAAAAHYATPRWPRSATFTTCCLRWHCSQAAASWTWHAPT
mmetsp:Transcript_5070/g.15384  ORF Transcript_5070/g.15384 Transcript_5070/m.15384 type:complete len:269 (+) Transcript_5070:802-1608(+)